MNQKRKLPLLLKRRSPRKINRKMIRHRQLQKKTTNLKMNFQLPLTLPLATRKIDNGVLFVVHKEKEFC